MIKALEQMAKQPPLAIVEVELGSRKTGNNKAPQKSAAELDAEITRKPTSNRANLTDNPAGTQLFSEDAIIQIELGSRIHTTKQIDYTVSY
ncbi:hypothetical protein H4Q26_011504 [Puccinia striiformis f. sp. tritici PST-130]|nr:hypothetical protein H4Q26_011504 [Puccinia striiformis f. sp. tritici PST-130]